ncbi:MAG: hypothetical protein HEEMFOPI_00149 [Holosporales bacterium]
MTDNIPQNNAIDDFDLWGDSTTVEETDVDRTLIRLSEYLLDEVAEMFDLVQSVFEQVYTTQENVTHEDRVKKELFAVVDSTASATNTILECAEALERISKFLPEDKQKEAVDHITKIYEACAFQDITGQRIKKVVIAILGLENRLGLIMEKILKSSKLKHVINADESTITRNNKDKMPTAKVNEQAGTIEKREPTSPIEEVQHSTDQLVYGPPLPENSTSQDAIDNLFKK